MPKKLSQKKKPLAVIISDVHYNLHTMDLADAAMRQAINKANSLEIPLIVSGDLHDSKAQLRAECVNMMIDTIKLCKIKPYIIVGNHDRIHEKAEYHSLNFLEPYSHLVSKHLHVESLNIFMLAYHHDPSFIGGFANHMGVEPIVIMHQGIQGSDSGEYIQDASAIKPEQVADLRVIGGHYHKRQDIKTGTPQKGNRGVFSYVGNPYTMSFAEANDPEKGYQILHDNGTLEFVPTNLRKHVVYESSVADLMYAPAVRQEDLVRIRVKGTKMELASLTRSRVQELTGISSFKLEFSVMGTAPNAVAPKGMTRDELIDSIIDTLSLDPERSNKIKALWRDLLCS